ncbi:Acb2/Tad1 domain-containing protein [Aeromonas dhakensis]|uniref:Acb2/Tad1 domain-containing protein n=1 Tax=Aeromonas dhakensis TaxID=196024 RepID=UPI0038D01DFE
MDNQHRKINGFRELDQAEIDLMNEVKAAELMLLSLHDKIAAHLNTQDFADDRVRVATLNAQGGAFYTCPEPSPDIVERHKQTEPRRWLAIAKTDLQTGLMAMTRAISQPTPVMPESVDRG